MISVSLLAAAIAFAIGGIPFGYLTGRLVLKDDIRRHGSGNTGATNVARTLGWKWGVLVLLLDALKGIVAVRVAPLLAETALTAAASAPATLLPVISGITAILGHMYPVWLRLRGGKGVATALGVVVMLTPLPSLTATAAFAVSFAVCRIVSLSSIIASVAFAIAYFVITGGRSLQESEIPTTVFALLIPAMIVWKHRSNIGRLLAGTEGRFQAAQTSAPQPDQNDIAASVRPHESEQQTPE